MKPRTSCDNCHIRKVKCDLAQKVEEGDADSQISCSICQSLGLSCEVSNNTKRKPEPEQAIGARHKRGKRIRALLEEQERAERLKSDILLAKKNESIQKPTSLSSYSNSIRSTQRLFNVFGLDEFTLNTCIDAYLNSIGAWMPLSQGEDTFRKRLKVLLYEIRGLPLENGMQAHQDIWQSYAIELLTLAVVARGATYLQFHDLSEAVTDRFVELASSGDTLIRSYLDGLEAVMILHENFFRSLYPIKKDGALQTCLELDLLGKGFPTELCLFHQLNIYSSEGDLKRKGYMFWSVYIFDAIRSASACRMYRLQEDDIGWPGSAPEDNPIIALSDVARKMCQKLFSARAKLKGLEDEDLNEILDSLQEWPKLCNFPMQVPETAHSEMIKIAFRIGLYLRMILSVWTAIQDVNIKSSATLRVEQFTSASAIHIDQLAQTCIQYDLVDCGSTLLTSTFAAWFMFMARRLRVGNSNYASTTDWQVLSQNMLSAIRQARRTKFAATLANSLQGILFPNDLNDDIEVIDIARVAETGEAPTNVSSPRSINPKERANSQNSSSRLSFPSEKEQQDGAFQQENTTDFSFNLNQTDLSLLSDNVLAWDPDLLAFLDASFPRSLS